ncbi:MAG: hypothetical protein JWQ38_2704 [Flavipsychrobacter sp.]|nr:hypothetical protein [Flavipsychrobacter sp.]
MKHTLLLTALSAALLFSNSSEAQIPGVSKVTKALPKVDLGIKIGGNFQQTTGAFFNQSMKPGITGGAFVGVSKNKIGVQAEALIRTAKIDVAGAVSGSSSVNTMALDIPIMFEYKFIPRLWVQVGPQFSQMLSAKNGSTDVKSNFNTTEFSAVLGLQAILPAHFVVGARYVYGLTDINNTSVTGFNDAWKNRAIQAYVGFRFL